MYHIVYFISYVLPIYISARHFNFEPAYVLLIKKKLLEIY